MEISYSQPANDESCAVAGEIYDPLNHICNCGRAHSCVKVEGMVNKYPNSSFTLLYLFVSIIYVISLGIKCFVYYFRMFR